jgi:hypothetical protein
MRNEQSQRKVRTEGMHSPSPQCHLTVVFSHNDLPGLSVLRRKQLKEAVSLCVCRTVSNVFILR